MCISKSQPIFNILNLRYATTLFIISYYQTINMSSLCKICLNSKVTILHTIIILFSLKYFDELEYLLDTL